MLTAPRDVDRILTSFIMLVSDLPVAATPTPVYRDMRRWKPLHLLTLCQTGVRNRFRREPDIGRNAMNRLALEKLNVCVTGRRE